MDMFRNTRRPLFVITNLMALIALLVGGIALATAQESDGRVNPVDHVGGAAVYCVDAQFEPSAYWNNGGIRVLDAGGQELLFASAADIIAAGNPPEETVRVGEGANAFGPLTLYHRPDSKFQLMGTDEWGKTFEFVWNSCGTFAAPQPELPVMMPTPVLPPPAMTISLT